MKIFMAQVKPMVGNLDYNFQLILEQYSYAMQNMGDICVLPELVTTGYTPEDLLLKPSFLQDLEKHIETLIPKIRDTILLLPTPFRTEFGLENGVLVIHNQKVIGHTSKNHLTNYKMFDEKRYFHSGDPQVIDMKGIKVGIPICEDIWFPDISQRLRKSGAQILIVPNASPFEENKFSDRLQMVQQRYTENALPILYCNQVLGQDGIIYDGRSFGYDGGQVIFTLKAFASDHIMITFDADAGRITSRHEIHDYCKEDLLYGAMVFGLREYVINNGFKKVILGLSGGVDSALVAAIATDALGPDNVRAIMLPFIYTTPHAIDDAKNIIKLLGINSQSIAINTVVDAAAASISHLSPTAYENLQARVRGMLLMTISNTTNELLLTTGNKSENATGYTTLYGDMCGAFNPIKDLYKTNVFHICRFRNNNLPKSIDIFNNNIPVMPDRVITKPPSAELRENQKDSDSLPDYSELDLILHGLIEDDLSEKEIIAQGFHQETVQKVIRLLKQSEYKRRQSAPGVKLTSKAFDKDRRYPLTL